MNLRNGKVSMDNDFDEATNTIMEVINKYGK